MFGLSPVQILIVLVIVLLLFGARRVPDMARGLGRGLREFRGGLTAADEGDGPTTPSPAPPRQPAADEAAEPPASSQQASRE